MEKEFQKELLLQFVERWLKPRLQTVDSIDDMCEYVGFERNAFNRFLLGKWFPSFSLILRLCHYLDLELKTEDLDLPF